MRKLATARTYSLRKWQLEISVGDRVSTDGVAVCVGVQKHKIDPRPQG